MKEFEVATFGGGCFWCVEAVIQRLKGVEKVVSGYAGGSLKQPTYREICTGTTGHAEVIQVTFNPDEISYQDLLQVFMTTHDPTTLNRQGADRGTQYRSTIMYTNESQKETALKIIADLKEYFDDPIVTEVVPLPEFYPAEAYHQDYYNQNGEQGYCVVVINPKIKKLRELYKDRLKPETY
ncbi:peptide-methionine (S)-S-oxide reductase MsrA [Pedobacter sp. MW01-1-1]|uniref:peptide-methionine (S)-S-oxide reductase MsrA n=1 Tax=Pedobacter sp. MW01-1-1 TaxID=3383027 RepID=UPI003FEDC04F